MKIRVKEVISREYLISNFYILENDYILRREIEIPSGKVGKWILRNEEFELVDSDEYIDVLAERNNIELYVNI